MSGWRRGLCLRKLCARLRGGAGAEAAPGAEALAGDAGACAQCRLPSNQCVCLDDPSKVIFVHIKSSIKKMQCDKFFCKLSFLGCQM